MPPVQNIAILVFFFKFFRYLGKSLKFFIFGFSAPLKEPTSCSKGFLVSIILIFLSFNSLFQFIGSICFLTLSVDKTLKPIGTTSSLILIFAFGKG
mgnify:CR=1 FL=1